MHDPLRHRLTAILVLALLGACSSGSGGEAVNGSVLGTVTVSAQPCSGGLGNLPGTTCQRLSVEGLGNAPIVAELRITDPPGAPIATVLMSSGGDGTGFYADLPGGEALLTDLLTQGFRVIDRRWEPGWFTTGEPFDQQAGRYATLLTWVRDNLLAGAALCASGNSAGSAEIAYALAHWDRSAILDAAVLSSGPPFTRLDYACGNPIPAEWFNLCSSVVPPGALDCGIPDCTLGNEIVLCSFLPANPGPGELEAASLLSPGAELSFPDTELRGLLGADDCTISVPLGLVFYQSLADPVVVDFVPGAPHTMPSTAAGRAAIVATLTDVVTGGPKPQTSEEADAPYRLELVPVASTDGARRETVWRLVDERSGRVESYGLLQTDERSSPASAQPARVRLFRPSERSR